MDSYGNNVVVLSAMATSLDTTNGGLMLKPYYFKITHTVPFNM